MLSIYGLGTANCGHLVSQCKEGTRGHVSETYYRGSWREGMWHPQTCSLLNTSPRNQLLDHVATCSYSRRAGHGNAQHTPHKRPNKAPTNNPSGTCEPPTWLPTATCAITKHRAPPEYQHTNTHNHTPRMAGCRHPFFREPLHLVERRHCPGEGPEQGRTGCTPTTCGPTHTTSDQCRDSCRDHNKDTYTKRTK